jgi:hypothetical protein
MKRRRKFLKPKEIIPFCSKYCWILREKDDWSSPASHFYSSLSHL